MRRADTHARPRRTSVARRFVTLGVTAALSLGAIVFGHALIANGSPASPQQARSPAPTSAATAAIRPGDNVTVSYTGKLEDGQVFDSSAQRAPLTFTVGSGTMINGFEHAVVGLHVGDSVTVRLEPEQAYGERRSDLVVTVPASRAPAGVRVGQRVTLGGRPAVVTRVAADGVTVDANPPLAGKVLTFQISVLSINNSDAQPPPASIR